MTKKTMTNGNPDDKQKQDLNKLQDKLSQQNETKRKVGRPPKERVEDAPPLPSSLPSGSVDFEPDFIITIFVKLPFERLAKERGEHWKLNADEETKLKELLAKLVAKYSQYIPQWVVKYNLELTGLLFVGSMITKRIQADYRLKREKKEQEQSEQKTP